MLTCGCGQILEPQEVSELDSVTYLLQIPCLSCGGRFGIETDQPGVSETIRNVLWTDEAQHALDRMPPYLEVLVREEVEAYAREKGVHLITFAFLIEARNHGAVPWHPEAESRLSRVPAAVRAMARVELERTALDRGMTEVTVSLMEEVKARYFGMGVKAT